MKDRLDKTYRVVVFVAIYVLQSEGKTDLIYRKDLL